MKKREDMRKLQENHETIKNNVYKGSFTSMVAVKKIAFFYWNSQFNSIVMDRQTDTVRC